MVATCGVRRAKLEEIRWEEGIRRMEAPGGISVVAYRPRWDGVVSRTSTLE